MLNLTRANLACGVVLTVTLETSGKAEHLPHGPWGLGRRAVPGLGLSGRNRGQHLPASPSLRRVAFGGAFSGEPSFVL